VEDLGFTIGPGTVTGYWVRTWRANDDERGSPPKSESRNQTNLGPSLSHRAPLHERRVRPVVR
jgi:hypothetical protein